MGQYNVLAIGDSLIKAKSDSLRGWAMRFSEALAMENGHELKYHNQGEGGDTSQDVRTRFASCYKLRSEWSLIILGVGINDSRKRGHPPSKYEVPIEQFEENVMTVCTNLERSGVELVVIPSVLPVIEQLTQPFKEDKYYSLSDSLRYGDCLESIVKRHEHLTYIDFRRHWMQLTESQRVAYMPDGLHPNESGHEYLANLATSELTR